MFDAGGVGAGFPQQTQVFAAAAADFEHLAALEAVFSQPAAELLEPVGAHLGGDAGGADHVTPVGHWLGDELDGAAAAALVERQRDAQVGVELICGGQALGGRRHVALDEQRFRKQRLCAEPAGRGGHRGASAQAARATAGSTTSPKWSR